MPKIPLTGGFTIPPVGTHVFKVTNVEYKPDFGKLNITLKTVNDETHIERFTFSSGNTGAANAFSYLAKTIMNDFSLKEIEPADLVGHYIRCVVTHEDVEDKNKPGSMKTYSRLGDKEAADGFDTAPVKTTTTSAPATKPKASTGYNLADLLGN